jgi:two-component system response regulator DevR
MTIHVLIVDDSELIRTSLRALLGSVAGVASIREAGTLSEALASVRANPPALVILDMNLPDGLGMDIIQPLKQFSPSVLIGVFTIDANPIHCQTCLALGADWFFDKATQVDALLGVVRQLAALKPVYPSNAALKLVPFAPSFKSQV